jgi:O-antigen/teichoic acid export membrane protein
MKPSFNDIPSLVRQNSLYVLSGKLLTPIVTFIMTGFIVRHISVQEYGVYNTLFAVLGYIGLFSSLGLLNIYQRFIPEFHYRNETHHIRKLVWLGSLLRMVLSLFFIAMILLFSKHSGKLFQIEGYFDYFEIFSLGVLFSLESDLLGLALTSLFLHKYFVAAQVLYTWIRAVLLFLVLRHGGTLENLLYCEIAGYGVLVVLQGYYYIRHFDQKIEGRPKTPFPWKRISRYGGFSYFNEMGEQVLDVSTDYLIISSFLGSVPVAIYAFANQIMRLLSRWMPHVLIIDVITPTFFTRYTHTQNKNELAAMFRLFVKFIAFFFFPLVAGVWVLGKPLIAYCFDPKYMNSFEVMTIVAVFTAINAFAVPLGLLVQSVEKVEIHFISKIFSIYNLIGDLVVVKPFGIVGVALVTGSAILFKNMLTYAYIRRTVRIGIPVRSLFVSAVNAVFMGVLIFALRGLVHGLVSFILMVCGGGIVYIVISAVHKPFHVDERELINKLIGKKLFIF